MAEGASEGDGGVVRGGREGNRGRSMQKRRLLTDWVDGRVLCRQPDIAVVSLAQTQEPLYLANRPGNRPSSEGAAEYLERALALCRRAGLRRWTLRGDTDFTQTRHLDSWDAERVRFLFGCDARSNLIETAEGLGKSAWKRLVRPERYAVRTTERTRPENVKASKVIERGRYSPFTFPLPWDSRKR